MTSYGPSAAINCADKCCFAFLLCFSVFQISAVVIKGVYYCGATRAIELINHLNYHSSYAPTYLGHDFRCRWLSMTCILKFHGEFLLHWKHDNSVAYQTGNFYLSKNFPCRRLPDLQAREFLQTLFPDLLKITVRSRGVTQQMFLRGGSAPRSNPFYIPSFTKKVPLS